MTPPIPFDELAPPDLVYRPREEIRAVQDRFLRQTIELCYRGHPYYRRAMRARGLTPADIQTVQDLAKLPVTTRQQFVADPEAFRLQVPDLPPEQRTLWEVVYTTGTTSGQPAPIYLTTWDHYAQLLTAARCADLLGIRETDTIANVFPLTTYPMGAYVRAPTLAAATGAAIVTVNPGRLFPDMPVQRTLDEAVRMVARHRATILWGVATFVRRMLMRAQELGADFSTVRQCSITGEATHRAMREDMRQRLLDLGSKEPRVLNRYGSTESSTTLECAEGSGWHNAAPGLASFEVVDPESGAGVGDGERGLLLVTHLIRRGTVLLRYSVGDLATMTDEVCPHCGRTTERILEPTRTGDLVKIKGMLVDLAILREELQSIPDLVDHQVVIRKNDPEDPFSMDELVLRVAASNQAREQVVGEVSARTLAATQIRPRVELVDPDEIFDPLRNPKPQRVVDLRPGVD